MHGLGTIARQNRQAAQAVARDAAKTETQQVIALFELAEREYHNLPQDQRLLVRQAGYRTRKR